MKIRRSILLLGAAVVVLIALLIWFANRPAEIVMPTLVETNAVTPPATEQTSTKPSRREEATHANAPIVQAVPSGNIPPPPTQTKAQQMQGVLATYNDVPIVFYGKLEDQFGNPVVGAQVAGNTIIYNGMKTGSGHVSTTSDANGLFKIDAGKGESLGIMPKKEGYVLATTGTAFKYSHLYEGYHVPDPNNPTVIKMWKLRGAEPLLSLDKKYKLQYKSAPIYFDMIAGKTVSSGGDLKITVSRPDGIISQQHPQNWSIGLEVVDGGFIETSSSESAIAYVAPAEGYQPSGTFGNNNGPDLVDKALFIQSRNGHVFSKVHLLFGINDTPDGFMSLTFSGVANTNSSRNWEATVPQ